MSDRVPKVTVVIPARVDQPELEAMAAVRQLDYPPDCLEIIVARGNQPSAQRNHAVREARGDLVYFLDDDSCPARDNLRRAVRHFEQTEVVMLGGPTLCPLDAPALEHVFQAVMGSTLAFGPSRARYRAVGTPRPTSEKELILCNLLTRRQALLEAGGFDEALYPNEENALMDELQTRGGRLLYDPEFAVYRRPRRTLGAFGRMVFTYGRGRAEQFRLHPTAGSILNFAPPLFCLFVLATPLWPAGCVWGWILYVGALLLQMMALRGETVWRRLGAAPLILVSHLGYGLGFWRGLLTPLTSGHPRGPVSIRLERIPLS